MPEFEVRTATRDEIDLMVDWAAAEGWNPGLGDAGPFCAADPDGYLIGLVDGVPAACISVVTYGENFSFLGFFICRPEYRGRGCGLAIWKAGMARLGSRTIGLDGVVEQQRNYAKSGFVLAHRNVRYGGTARGEDAASDNLVELLPARRDGLAEAVVGYDRRSFPGARETFLRAWIVPPRRTIAFVDDSGVRGFGTVRACRNGHKIGPLFADTAPIADRLFRALAGPLGGEAIFLDVPEPNTAALALAERYDMKPVFETARMYRGDTPALPLERIFGITTFELG